MRRLFLLRHAKAGAEGPDDKRRRLIARGREDAVRMGHFLSTYAIDVALCSTASRTRETLGLILPQLAPHPAVHYLDELYLAESETILALVRRAHDTAGALMIVGHNPGLEECAQALVHPPDERKLRKRYSSMCEKFPTGTLAIIDFEAEHWSAIGGWVGELEQFVRPKDLREEIG